MLAAPLRTSRHHLPPLAPDLLLLLTQYAARARTRRWETQMDRPDIPIPKKRGRPATGTGELVGVRLHPDDLAALDRWRSREPDRPGRPEAIRRLLTIALRWRSAEPSRGSSPRVRR